jgi:hypothetical protein
VARKSIHAGGESVLVAGESILVGRKKPAPSPRMKSRYQKVHKSLAPSH